VVERKYYCYDDINVNMRGYYYYSFAVGYALITNFFQ
jgi:hypothetical protein